MLQIAFVIVSEVYVENMIKEERMTFASKSTKFNEII